MLPGALPIALRGPACNDEELQQNYCLGTASNSLLGAQTCVTGSKPSPFSSAVVQNIWSACRSPNRPVNHHRNQRITNKNFEELEKRTRQKQGIVTPANSRVSNNTTEISGKKRRTS